MADQTEVRGDSTQSDAPTPASPSKQRNTSSMDARSASLDRWLTVGVWVALLALLATGGWFGYSVYAQDQAERLANPAQQVIAAARAALAKNRSDATLYAKLGEALASGGYLDEAEAQLAAAIKIEPKYVGAYQDLAQISMMRKDYKTAKTRWQKIIDLTADQSMQNVNEYRDVAFFNLGEIALIDKDYSTAVGYFNAAIRINKSAGDTYLLLAKAYRGLGDDDSAMDALKAALAFDPKYAEAHFVRGEIYLKRGDLADAAWDFRAALDSAPGQPEAQSALDSLGTFATWFGKAQTAWSSKDTSAALDAVRIARSIDPGSYDAAMLNGQILESSHDTTGAISAYDAALTAKPDDPAATKALARVKE